MIGTPHELVLSPRVTVEVAELDGYELDMADSIMSARTSPIKEGERDPRTGEVGPAVVPLMEMGFKQPRIYGICSIRSINGSPVKPFANMAEYASAAGQLGSTELRALAKWAQPLYSPEEEKPQAKNDEAAQPSDS